MALESSHVQTVHVQYPQPPRRISDETIGRLRAAVSAKDFDVFCDLVVSAHDEGNIHDLYPVMYEAIRRDYATFVAKLLHYGLDMRYTFALEAISAKAQASLREFLWNGWDINAPISETEPGVLAHAVADTEMTLWLLDEGADLNRPTYIDLTPMSYAVRFAPLALVQELLDRGGDVQKGELLQHALDRPADTSEVVALLLDRGAPLNTVMYENHDASRRLYPFMEFGTPLHKAAELGKADVVQDMLRRGANVAIRNARGRTAMECAERAGHLEVVAILGSATGSTR